MKPLGEVLAWARTHADRLQNEMVWVQSETPGVGWWKAKDPRSLMALVARATAALDFLQTYAGQDSEWTLAARRLYDGQGHHQSTESGIRAIGDLLREWADQVDHGILEVPGMAVATERAIAATDLMEQVHRLVEDRSVHPAAAIVLCGAALEIGLRAAVEGHGLDPPAEASIDSLARVLRRSNFISAQDMKDVTQMAGMRNAAAHGSLEELSKERAGLMEQQANLFLGRLRNLLRERDAPVPAHDPVADGESTNGF